MLLMGVLLTPQQILDIEAAVGLVTDQFFTTPVVYQRYTTSLDPYQEDQDAQLLTTWDLMGIVTPVEWNSTLVEESPDGSRQLNEITITLSMNDLLLIPGVILMPGYVPDMDPTSDYLYLTDTSTPRYRILKVSKNAPLTEKDLLVKIRARIEEKVL